MVGYHVADANSYIIVTGYGIENVKIVKKAMVWPFQRVSTISISPFDFSITLQAMTMEKLQFSLPAVFTIGPDNEPKALLRYAMLLTGNADGTPAQTKSVSTGRSHVQDIVKGIIEGETRVIVSGMSMEEIFNQRQIFKTKIIENVQGELAQFGLKM
jgi:flotillin